jgi:hypothetical protein
MTPTAAVKERPILFSAPMVKAILAGRKTQTRRVVKGPITGVHEGVPYRIIHGGHDCDGANFRRDIKCPYGQPGDRLWVRETFSLVPCSAGCEKYPNGFDPTIASVRQPNAPHEGVRYRATWDKTHSARWRPSIHMPRWASRITLEITDVRVERLHGISESDKLAEGATPEVPFGTVWRKINTKPGIRWEDNPWVWALTFRRITE